MLSYAGIGSRTITKDEEETIHKIADKLSKKFVLYSGNAPGSDQAFQNGSNGKCVLFLPWASFESDKYDFYKALDFFDVGKSEEGMKSIEKYHPNPHLKYGAKLCLARNYHQIHGYKMYPRVSFVICCADEDDKGNILGGTGFACRIAKELSIPIINIRQKDWKTRLSDVISALKPLLKMDA
jgi:hypothetical protein